MDCNNNSMPFNYGNLLNRYKCYGENFIIYREVINMGLAYKVFQHISYDALGKAREKGKKVDKEMQKERQNKLWKEARDMVDYDALDKHWDDMIQGYYSCEIGKKSRTSHR